MSFAVSPGGPRTWHQYAKATRSAGGDGLSLSLTPSLTQCHCAAAAAGRRRRPHGAGGVDASVVPPASHRRSPLLVLDSPRFQNKRQTIRPWLQSPTARRRVAGARFYPSAVVSAPVVWRSWLSRGGDASRQFDLCTGLHHGSVPELDRATILKHSVREVRYVRPVPSIVILASRRGRRRNYFCTDPNLSSSACG